MKRSLPSLLCAVALGLAFAPLVSLADYNYTSAEQSLNKLETIVTLTPAQQNQALQIYQNLKEAMDNMDAADRPSKGPHARADALAAIRAILTPEQQAIFDRTPVRLGGGSTKIDPIIQALNLKIRTFVTDVAKTSPDIAAQVGTVQKAVPLVAGSSTLTKGSKADPQAHPDSGANLVRVIGSSGAKTFKISWDMNGAGEMTATKVATAAD